MNAVDAPAAIPLHGSLDRLMREPERLARFYLEATRLSSASSPEAVLRRLVHAARSLTRADSATLTVTDEEAPEGGRAFAAGHRAAAAATLELPVLVDGHPYGTLRLATSRTSFLPAEEALAGLLCIHAGLAIEKVTLHDMEHVLGRVKDALGLLARTAADANLRQVGDIRLDLGRNQVYVADTPVHLTPSEFRLLELLTEEPGRTYTRYEITARLWGIESSSGLRVADINVTRLRRKIERDPRHPTHIETVRGVGYRLAAD